jgi:hypothetical protein
MVDSIVLHLYGKFNVMLHIIINFILNKVILNNWIRNLIVEKAKLNFLVFFELDNLFYYII